MRRETLEHSESSRSDPPRSTFIMLYDPQGPMMRGLLRAVIVSGAIWAALGWAWLLLH